MTCHYHFHLLLDQNQFCRLFLSLLHKTYTRSLNFPIDRTVGKDAFKRGNFIPNIPYKSTFIHTELSRYSIHLKLYFLLKYNGSKDFEQNI